MRNMTVLARMMKEDLSLSLAREDILQTMKILEVGEIKLEKKESSLA